VLIDGDARFPIYRPLVFLGQLLKSPDQLWRQEN